MGLLQQQQQQQPVGMVVFTPAQLRELQHQALVLKYIMNGVNVPLELVHPLIIRPGGVGAAAAAAGLLSAASSPHHLLHHHHHLANRKHPKPFAPFFSMISNTHFTPSLLSLLSVSITHPLNPMACVDLENCTI